MTDLTALEEAAKKATPGPWCKDTYECRPGDLGKDTYGIFELGEDDPAIAYVGPWCEAESNAAFIAIANPSAILSLISTIRDLERKRDEAQGVVRDTLWMAGRYADGRMTYAVGDYNRCLKIAERGGYADAAKPAIDGQFDDVKSRCETAFAEGRKAGMMRAAEIADAHKAPGGITQIDYDEACSDIATAIRAEAKGSGG